ncbi:MAG: hypothetical protein V4615_05275 [Bacteroidota bacterium]
MKILFLLALLVSCGSVHAQLHLGKSEDALISSLGSEYTKVSDENGNDVLAYYTDINEHPKFGDYSLLSSYFFENKSCVMQQTLMPASQLNDLVSGFNSLYQKVGDLMWRSKEGIYYLLSVESGTLRMKVLADSIYERQLH